MNSATSDATQRSAPSKLSSRGVKIVLDVVLLVGFIAEFVTREGPDYAIHSWIGIVLIPIVAVHLVSNRRWVMSTIRRRTAHPEWPLARFNAIFGVVAAVCIITGFWPWLEWSGADPMALIHTVTGFASILMMFSHLWRNRRRIGGLVRRRAA